MNAADGVRFVLECARDAPRIFVRAQRDGRWGTFALSDLPLEQQAAFVTRWLLEERKPVVA